eukprot:151317-Chlamydomonas_euryale.AAC.20
MATPVPPLPPPGCACPRLARCRRRPERHAPLVNAPSQRTKRFAWPPCWRPGAKSKRRPPLTFGSANGKKRGRPCRQPRPRLTRSCWERCAAPRRAVPRCFATSLTPLIAAREQRCDALPRCCPPPGHPARRQKSCCSCASKRKVKNEVGLARCTAAAEAPPAAPPQHRA